MEQARQLIGATPVGTDGSPLNEVEIRSHWKGDVCRLRLINHRKESVRVREVVLLDLEHRLPGSTSVYGEGFQMLSQTSGTLAEPRDVGSYTDRGHYRLPEPKGLRAVYGMLLLTPPAGGERYLAAFGSCRRFNGAWQFNERRLRAVLEMEDLELPAGESWELEDLVFKKGESRESLLTSLGSILNRNHPRLRHDPVPTGWCSWYCFGPSVTARNIDDNLSWIATHLPALRYIQIDDG